MSATPSPIQHPNYVPAEQLATVALWLAQLRRDKPYSQFHLIQVSFGPSAAWGQAYGAQEGASILNDFGKQLAGALRNTDLVSRTNTVFWVLTPPDDMDPVLERLLALMSEFFDNASPATQCELACYALNNPEMSEQRLRGLLTNAGVALSPFWHKTWPESQS